VRGQGGAAVEEVVGNCVFHMNYNRNGYKLERCVDREAARAIIRLNRSLKHYRMDIH
jgi:hypothetical protein